MEVKPIKPSQVAAVRAASVPDDVIEVVNSIIVQKWNGVVATVLQDEVIRRVLLKRGLNPNDRTARDVIFNGNQLDFEQVFRNAGWSVEYDKPGHNEMYDARWYFKKK